MAEAEVWIREGSDGIYVDLLVQPRASRTRVVGEHGGRLKVQVTAPPVEGEANAALVDLFAGLLSVPKRDVEIAAGSTGKRKTLHVRGLDRETVRHRLASKAS